jgi:hypothetical protein
MYMPDMSEYYWLLWLLSALLGLFCLALAHETKLRGRRYLYIMLAIHMVCPVPLPLGGEWAFYPAWGVVLLFALCPLLL